MTRILARILRSRKPMTYCTCGADAVFPRTEPRWCEVCYPTIWRKAGRIQ